MALISKIKVPGVSEAYDIADKTLGLSTKVEDEVWEMGLVRDEEGLPDTESFTEEIAALQTGKQDVITVSSTDNEMLEI